MGPIGSRRPADFYLGRVTAMAYHFQRDWAEYGPNSYITRARGNAYSKAVEVALTRGRLSLGQVAAASGIGFETHLPVSAEAMRATAELDEVRRALAPGLYRAGEAVAS